MGLAARGWCSGRLGLADAHCRGMGCVDLHLVLRLRDELISAIFIPFSCSLFPGGGESRHCVDTEAWDRVAPAQHQR